MKYLLLILTISLISAHSHASQKADRDTELYKRDKQHKTISTYFTSAVVKQIKKFKHAHAFKATMDKYTTSEIEVENAVIKVEYDVFVPVYTLLLLNIMVIFYIILMILRIISIYLDSQFLGNNIFNDFNHLANLMELSFSIYLYRAKTHYKTHDKKQCKPHKTTFVFLL